MRAYLTIEYEGEFDPVTDWPFDEPFDSKNPEHREFVAAWLETHAYPCEELTIDGPH